MAPAGQLVVDTLDALRRAVRPGVTTGELDAIAAATLAAARATPLFKNYPHPLGMQAFPSVTCISVNEEVVHGIPGARLLNAGDVVSLDTGCRLNGWCGDAAITVPVGPVTPDVQRLLETGAGVLELAVELTAKKERWSQVAAEMQKFVASQGCGMVDALVGHGIGRRMHEPPEVPNVDTPEWREKDFLLEPGLVLAIEPMVALGSGDVMCLEDGWTVVTQDGRWAAHFERTVAIGPDGPIVLTPWK